MDVNKFFQLRHNIKIHNVKINVACSTHMLSSYYVIYIFSSQDNVV